MGRVVPSRAQLAWLMMLVWGLLGLGWLVPLSGRELIGDPRAKQLVEEGRQLALKKHDWQGALAKFQRAHQILPQNGIILYFIGKCYNRMKEYAKAWKYLQQAENHPPFYAYLYFEAAIALVRLGRWEEAKEYAEKFLMSERNPRYLASGQKLWSIIQKQLARQVKAKEAQDEGIRLYRAGKYDQAYQAFRKADQLAPRNGHLHYLMGLCLLQLDQPREALQELYKSKELGYVPREWALYVAWAKAQLGEYGALAEQLGRRAASEPEPRRRRKLEQYQQRLEELVRRRRG